MTPLGTPVEPEVYRMYARSLSTRPSGRTGEPGKASSAVHGSARRSSEATPAGESVNRRDSTAVEPSAAGPSDRTLAADVIRARAPELASTWVTSAAGACG